MADTNTKYKYKIQNTEYKYRIEILPLTKI